MEHDLTLVTTLAAGFCMALFFGVLAEKIKLPALVGFLFAGVCLGPATPGFVADASIAAQLSEVGIILLMFGVGLHFSIDHLLSVKKMAIPGAVGQMAAATVLGALVAHAWGYELETALFFGLSLSCASTVVLIKALESRHLMDTMNGRIAVGWLVVEDLATIVILVLLPPLAGFMNASGDTAFSSTTLLRALLTTTVEIVGFIALMLIVARRALPWFLGYVARTGSRELFTLAVIAAAIGIAYGAAVLFHVSFALGAFFAGMVLSESSFSHRAAQDSLPLRDAFSVLFFVSVGMLFEPSILIQSPLSLLLVIAIVILGKALAAGAIVLAFRYPLGTALTVAASLSQIGEFSFILAGMGVSLGLLSQQGMSLIVAAALISIALNPLLFALIAPIKKWTVGHSRLARRLDSRLDPLSELPKATDDRYTDGQVIIVGYGSVGRKLAAYLTPHRIPLVILDENRETVEALRQQQAVALCGNAIDPVSLVQAHIMNARMIVIAVPDPVEVRCIADNARKLNPHVEIVLRTRSDSDLPRLRAEGLGIVFCAKEQLAKGMAHHVIDKMTPSPNED